ncbi:MAG: hypothetical protein JW388_0837 [Nitrospira sp.]|nr:hypothetical protein [Nitrospira sp.]
MLTEQRQQVLTILYPLYKEEVARRREQMIWLTAFGSLGLITLLGSFMLSPQKDLLTSIETFFLGLASVTWCGLICALILQQQSRHRLAKQLLIQLEQILGWYETGLFVENQALYPEGWKTAWLNDRTGLLYFTTLGSLTALFLLALFFS